MKLGLYEIIWIFFIYAVLGWATEVVFAACKQRKFVNRGFLNGPLCPIYGFGMLSVIAVLSPLRDNIGLLFVGSVVFTTLLELVTGWALERLFSQKWWDYTGMWGNIGGYICPLFSLLWGLACVVVLRFVHPLIAGLIERVPHTLGVVLLAVFGAIFIADTAITLIAVAKLPKKLAAVDELKAALTRVSDELGEGLSGGAIAIAERADRAKEVLEEKKSELEERGEKLLESADEKKAELEATLKKYRAVLSEHSFVYRRLFDAFPNLSTGRFAGLRQRLREERETRRSEKKNK